MDLNLEQTLIKKYPSLYLNYKQGISCGDGWYNIIDQLSEKLQQFGVVAAQVKEKFGGLRFYIAATPSEHFKEIRQYIDEAEELSLKTCEKCGNPGTIRKGSWIRCLCDNCQ